jgi:hypothetical protein
MSRVHGPDGANQVENLLIQLGQTRRGPRMKQLPYLSSEKSVRVQIIFFDFQRTIVALEISGSIIFDPVTKNEVLRPCR